MLWPTKTNAQYRLVKEVNLTQHGSQDRYGTYSPDGLRILFESDRDGNWEIYLMNRDGSELSRLTDNEAEDRRPSWHPSGHTILFESDRSGNFELFTLDLFTKAEEKITGLPEGHPMFARYSPDGNSMAFSLVESDSISHLMLYDLNTSSLRQLTDNNYRNYFPQWSSNGEELLFFSRKDTENQDDEIYRFDLTNRSEVRLTHWPMHNFCPSWSPDDQWITYAISMEDRRPEIYIMDRDGKNRVRLTFNEDGDTLPCWAKDGENILITGYRNGNFELIELKIASY